MIPTTVLCMTKATRMPAPTPEPAAIAVRIRNVFGVIPYQPACTSLRSSFDRPDSSKKRANTPSSVFLSASTPARSSSAMVRSTAERRTSSMTAR